MIADLNSGIYNIYVAGQIATSGTGTKAIDGCYLGGNTFSINHVNFQSGSIILSNSILRGRIEAANSITISNCTLECADNNAVFLADTNARAITFSISNSVIVNTSPDATNCQPLIRINGIKDCLFTLSDVAMSYAASTVGTSGLAIGFEIYTATPQPVFRGTLVNVTMAVPGVNFVINTNSIPVGAVAAIQYANVYVLPGTNPNTNNVTKTLLLPIA
jgi:hypothetical protein